MIDSDSLGLLVVLAGMIMCAFEWCTSLLIMLVAPVNLFLNVLAQWDRSQEDVP